MAKIIGFVLVAIIVEGALCQSFEWPSLLPPHIHHPQVVIKEEIKKDCGCKPEVFYHKLKPIIVDAKPKHVNIGPNSPIIVNTPPVIIRRPGCVEIRPIIAKHQPKDKIIPKKIVKVVRPVYKKYFEEKFVKKEYPCPEETVEVIEEPPKEEPHIPCIQDKIIVEENCGCGGGSPSVDIVGLPKINPLNILPPAIAPPAIAPPAYDMKNYRVEDFDFTPYIRT